MNGPPPKNPFEENSGYAVEDDNAFTGDNEFGNDDPYKDGGGYSDRGYGNDPDVRDVELGYDNPGPTDMRTAPPPATFNTENAGMRNNDKEKSCSDYIAEVPIQWLSILGAIWMASGAILNMVFSGGSPSVVILDGYMVFFGLIMLCVQFPKFPGYDWTSPIRKKIEKWALFMATLWGRGMFFIFVAFMCLAESSTIRILMGISVIMLGFLSLFAGRIAAGKFNRINEYAQAGKEGDELVMQLKGLARELTQGTGSLKEEHFRQLGIRAGRRLTNAELHAIFAFFDRDRNGEVSVDTFVAVLMSPLHKNIKSL